MYRKVTDKGVKDKTNPDRVQIDILRAGLPEKPPEKFKDKKPRLGPKAFVRGIDAEDPRQGIYCEHEEVIRLKDEGHLASMRADAHGGFYATMKIPESLVKDKRAAHKLEDGSPFVNAYWSGATKKFTFDKYRTDYTIDKEGLRTYSHGLFQNLKPVTEIDQALAWRRGNSEWNAKVQQYSEHLEQEQKDQDRRRKQPRIADRPRASDLAGKNIPENKSSMQRPPPPPPLRDKTRDSPVLGGRSGEVSPDAVHSPPSSVSSGSPDSPSARYAPVPPASNDPRANPYASGPPSPTINSVDNGWILPDSLPDSERGIHGFHVSSIAAASDVPRSRSAPKHVSATSARTRTHESRPSFPKEAPAEYSRVTRKDSKTLPHPLLSGGSSGLYSHEVFDPKPASDIGPPMRTSSGQTPLFGTAASSRGKPHQSVPILSSQSDVPTRGGTSGSSKTPVVVASGIPVFNIASLPGSTVGAPADPQKTVSPPLSVLGIPDLCDQPRRDRIFEIQREYMRYRVINGECQLSHPNYDVGEPIITPDDSISNVESRRGSVAPSPVFGTPNKTHGTPLNKPPRGTIGVDRFDNTRPGPASHLTSPARSSLYAHGIPTDPDKRGDRSTPAKGTPPTVGLPRGPPHGSASKKDLPRHPFRRTSQAGSAGSRGSSRNSHVSIGDHPPEASIHGSLYDHIPSGGSFSRRAPEVPQAVSPGYIPANLGKACGLFSASRPPVNVPMDFSGQNTRPKSVPGSAPGSVPCLFGGSRLGYCGLPGEFPGGFDYANNNSGYRRGSSAGGGGGGGPPSSEHGSNPSEGRRPPPPRQPGGGPPDFGGGGGGDPPSPPSSPSGGGGSNGTGDDFGSESGGADDDDDGDDDSRSDASRASAVPCAIPDGFLQVITDLQTSIQQLKDQAQLKGVHPEEIVIRPYSPMYRNDPGYEMYQEGQDIPDQRIRPVIRRIMIYFGIPEEDCLILETALLSDLTPFFAIPDDPRRTYSGNDGLLPSKVHIPYFHADSDWSLDLDTLIRNMMNTRRKAPNPSASDVLDAYWEGLVSLLTKLRKSEKSSSKDLLASRWFDVISGIREDASVEAGGEMEALIRRVKIRFAKDQTGINDLDDVGTETLLHRQCESLWDVADKPVVKRKDARTAYDPFFAKGQRMLKSFIAIDTDTTGASYQPIVRRPGLLFKGSFWGQSPAAERHLHKIHLVVTAPHKGHPNRHFLAEISCIFIVKRYFYETGIPISLTKYWVNPLRKCDWVSPVGEIAYSSSSALETRIEEIERELEEARKTRLDPKNPKPPADPKPKPPALPPAPKPGPKPKPEGGPKPKPKPGPPPPPDLPEVDAVEPGGTNPPQPSRHLSPPAGKWKDFRTYQEEPFKKWSLKTAADKYGSRLPRQYDPDGVLHRSDEKSLDICEPCFHKVCVGGKLNCALASLTGSEEQLQKLNIAAEVVGLTPADRIASAKSHHVVSTAPDAPKKFKYLDKFPDYETALANVRANPVVPDEHIATVFQKFACPNKINVESSLDSHPGSKEGLREYKRRLKRMSNLVRNDKTFWVDSVADVRARFAAMTKETPFGESNSSQETPVVADTSTAPGAPSEVSISTDNAANADISVVGSSASSSADSSASSASSFAQGGSSGAASDVSSTVVSGVAGTNVFSASG